MDLTRLNANDLSSSTTQSAVSPEGYPTSHYAANVKCTACMLNIFLFRDVAHFVSSTNLYPQVSGTYSMQNKDTGRTSYIL
jgi:hypothetical protein